MAAAADVGAAEREGLARLHRHAPQVDVADGVEGQAHDVVRPDRHATRHDDDVGLGDPAPQPRLDVLEPVGRDPELQRHAARLPHQRADPGAVRVRDPRRPEVGSRRPDLVAGREHRDDRAAADDDVGEPRARCQRHDGRRHRRTRLDDRRAGLGRRSRACAPRCRRSTASWTRHAAGNGPAASRPRGPGLPVTSSGVVISTGTTASAPGGHRRAGRDPDRGLGHHPGIGRRARPRLPDDRESHRPALGRAGHVRRAHRVAVHRGVVPGRQRDARDDRLGQDATQRGLGDDPLDVGQRLDAGEHRRLGRLDGEELAAHRIPTCALTRSWPPAPRRARGSCPRGSRA